MAQFNVGGHVSDPVQRTRIRKAELKRSLRAIDRTFREIESWGRNPTIDHYDPRRNPRHIAK